MTPIKVVHVHKIAGVSGSEKHLLQMLPALDRSKFDVVMMMLTGSPPVDARFAESLREAGVRVERLRIRADVDPALLIHLVRWFRREQPDIVHTHLIHADLHGILAARLSGVPIVISTKHNDDRFRRHAAIVALERWLARRTHRTVTISEALRRFVLTTTRQDPERVQTIHYGYQPEADTRDHREAMAPAPIARGGKSVLAVGRLVDQKGHDVLVTAFSIVRRRVPDASLVIVGAGPGRARLEQLVRKHDLGSHVILAGHRADAPALMQRAAVFAHPSRWEGFGLVLLEAMAAARPIVASAVSAIPEIVQQDETGLLVPADDPAALADALVRLLEDRALAERMGRQGRDRLEREFSRERMAGATEALYRGALEAMAGGYGRTRAVC